MSSEINCYRADEDTGSKEYMLMKAYHGLLAALAYNDEARQNLKDQGVDEFVRIAKKEFSGQGFSEDNLREIYHKLMQADKQRRLYEAHIHG